MASNATNIINSSAFIEIETDFEYVHGVLEERAARFLMDFYHVQGDLEYTLKQLADALVTTAREYLELQGIPANSNLGKGIEAHVRGSAIELRSTAYRLPLWGRTHGTSSDEGDVVKGKSVARRRRKAGGEFPKEKKNRNRSMFMSPYGVVKTANQMILPQGIDYNGATGGHYSLAAVPVKDAEGFVHGYDSHGARYGIRKMGTKNVQYYGAHVEFGHKTRDGGGIGFVQARPHLRPALRTVADASTGMLSTTLAHMMYGFGNTFDSLKHEGRTVYGLNFGNIKPQTGAIKHVIHSSSKSLDERRALQLRKAFSVAKPDANTSAYIRYESRDHRRTIGFGKNISYRRYGYHEGTVSKAREVQRHSTDFNPDHKLPYDFNSYVKASTVRDEAHASGRYKYRNNVNRKRVMRRQKAAANRTRAKKQVEHEMWHQRAEKAYKHMNELVYKDSRTRAIPKNTRGKDKTRLAQPQDFDYKGSRQIMKPTEKYRDAFTEKEFADWERAYEGYWDTLVAQARRHNEPFFNPLTKLLFGDEK